MIRASHHVFKYPRLGIWAMTLFLLIAPAVGAMDTTSPQELLETASREMIAALKADPGAARSDPRHLHKLVTDILLPHVDIISTSRWVLGKHWRTATKEQKKQFIREFRTLLIRFYSAALSDYLAKNEVNADMIRFQKFRARPEDTDVTIRSEVSPAAGKAVPVNYHMHKRRGRWQVYDVSVEGVSLITTYRSSFATEIKQNGLDGLITSLTERNRKLLEDANIVQTSGKP